MNIYKAKTNARDKYSALNRTAVSWRAVALAESIAIIALAIGLTLLSRQQKIVPWVVQVDKHHFEIAAGAAELTTARDPRVIIARIGRFIEGYKSITADPTAQQWLLTNLVYSTLAANSPAHAAANQYYRSNDPFKRYKDDKTTVGVEVRTILPMGKNSWRAEWIETIFINGVIDHKENWSGLFTINISPSADTDRIRTNPLGIYITDFTVSRNFN